MKPKTHAWGIHLLLIYTILKSTQIFLLFSLNSQQSREPVGEELKIEYTGKVGKEAKQGSKLENKLQHQESRRSHGLP